MSRPPRAPFVAYAALLVAVFVSACASLPPQKPVTSVSQIAGKWEGVGQGTGSAVQTVTTINPDGTYTSVVGGRTFTGKITLTDGQLRGKGDQTGNTGTWTLHEGDGKRVLRYKSDDGRVTAEATPAK